MPSPSEQTRQISRRAALRTGVAALGGAGIASLAGVDQAFAATTEYFLNAVDFEGVDPSGKTDSTTGLQEAIDEAIAIDRPLYLPPGKYVISSGLKAATSNFSIFGAGSRRSVIYSASANYTLLTIGPGEGGSGNSPTGYARDFGFSGGNADWDASGTSPVTEKAVLRIAGMRRFEVRNVTVLAGSEFDIGFELDENPHGCTFRNCHTALQSCRVGLNIRGQQVVGGEVKRVGAGSDCTFFNCWLFGEVAAVCIGGYGGGYHFYGGRLTACTGAGVLLAGRGTVILGWDYQLAFANRAATCTFEGVSIRALKTAWLFSARAEVSVTIKDCSLIGGTGAEVKAGGFFTSLAFESSRLTLINNHVSGWFSSLVGKMLVLEEAHENRSLTEVGTSGSYVQNGTTINASAKPLVRLALEGHCFAVGPQRLILDQQALRRGASGCLEATDSAELTWRIVSPTMLTIASAATITIPSGVTLAVITGTTKITKINASDPGQQVVLKFDSTAAVASGFDLRLEGEFKATANDTLTLVSQSASAWHEVSRSVN